MCPLDYTDIVVSGMAEIPSTCLTTQIGLLPPPQLTVLSRSAILLPSKFWWRFCVVILLLGLFCRCKGFCRRTESDLFLSLCTEWRYNGKSYRENLSLQKTRRHDKTNMSESFDITPEKQRHQKSIVFTMHDDPYYARWNDTFALSHDHHHAPC